MDIRQLPATEAAVRRFVGELWLPYHRELERTVARHALAEDVDLVAEEVPYRLERLREPSHRAWVAVDAETERSGAIAETDAALAGFLTTDLDESPPVFDRPDRLIIGDLYVREPHRGTGLARDLIDTANARALDEGIAEIALEVDIDNDRARTFYEALGFEPSRLEMARSVERC